MGKYKIITEPRQYQLDGAKMIWDFGGRALLGDDPGLGKTLTSYLFAFQASTARPVIIVCPAHLRKNWWREGRTHFGFDPDVIRHTAVNPGIIRRGEFIILSYNALASWNSYLQSLDPQLVIVDEGHYVKTPSAKRTKAVRALCKDTPHVLLLTGTPVINNPIEIWTLLDIIAPGEFGTRTEFGMRYTNATYQWWGWQFKGVRKAKELHKKLREVCLIRRTKSEVLKELPPKTRIVIPVPIEKRKEYEHAERDLIGWLRTFSPARANKAAKAERLAKFGYLKRLAARLKMKSAVQWLDDMLEESDSKFIVPWIHHAIREYLESAYHGEFLTIKGGMSDQQKDDVLNKFRMDGKARLLFGQMTAAGTGNNIQCADIVATMELPWTPGEMIQMEDRAHRMGQTKHVYCYSLVAEDTIEEYLCEVLQDKQNNIINPVVDGDNYVEDLNVFDQLALRMLEKGKRMKAGGRKP